MRTSIMISVMISMLAMPIHTANPGENIRTLFPDRNKVNMDIPSAVNFENSPLYIRNENICFRGRSGEECDYFFISENGFTPILMRNDSRHHIQYEWFVWSYEFGLMKNYQRNRAIGGSIFFAIDDRGHRWAAKFRYRRWIGKHSINISPGIFLKVYHDRYNSRFPSFTSHVGLNYHDILILTLQLDVIRYKNHYFAYRNPGEPGTDVTLYGGLKFGSYASIATVSLSLATLATAIIIYVGSDPIHF